MHTHEETSLPVAFNRPPPDRFVSWPVRAARNLPGNLVVTTVIDLALLAGLQGIRRIHDVGIASDLVPSALSHAVALVLLLIVSATLNHVLLAFAVEAARHGGRVPATALPIILRPGGRTPPDLRFVLSNLPVPIFWGGFTTYVSLSASGGADPGPFLNNGMTGMLSAVGIQAGANVLLQAPTNTLLMSGDVDTRTFILTEKCIRDKLGMFRIFRAPAWIILMSGFVVLPAAVSTITGPWPGGWISLVFLPFIALVAAEIHLDVFGQPGRRPQTARPAGPEHGFDERRG